ncbi:hypothetical protein [Rhizohabitans arisaemae]|uniref:hypothetical protein n=1 Tax=Rhizohabitans arisaemae TaxID=2720610 RepID=UPI0024B25DCE|nr:hypothetical protein [Rhizohabitans arisaemae]
MKPLALWSHELRRAGPAALLAAPILATLTSLFAVFSTELGTRDGVTEWFLLGAVEMGIPLVAGMAAASLLGQDRALELQLTFPRRYRGTVLRRLTVAFGAVAGSSLICSAVLLAAGWRNLSPDYPASLTGQLTWLAPTLWLAALGLFAAAVLRSTAGATTVVAFVWGLQQLTTAILQENHVTRLLYLFDTTRGTVPEDWLWNRFTLLATALPLLAVAWYLLGDTEWVKGGGSE